MLTGKLHSKQFVKTYYREICHGGMWRLCAEDARNLLTQSLLHPTPRGPSCLTEFFFFFFRMHYTCSLWTLTVMFLRWSLFTRNLDSIIETGSIFLPLLVATLLGKQDCGNGRFSTMLFISVSILQLPTHQETSVGLTETVASWFLSQVYGGMFLNSIFQCQPAAR